MRYTNCQCQQTSVFICCIRTKLVAFLAHLRIRLKSLTLGHAGIVTPLLVCWNASAGNTWKMILKLRTMYVGELTRRIVLGHEEEDLSGLSWNSICRQSQCMKRHASTSIRT